MIVERVAGVIDPVKVAGVEELAIVDHTAPDRQLAAADCLLVEGVEAIEEQSVAIGDAGSGRQARISSNRRARNGRPDRAPRRGRTVTVGSPGCWGTDEAGGEGANNLAIGVSNGVPSSVGEPATVKRWARLFLLRERWRRSSAGG